MDLRESASVTVDPIAAVRAKAYTTCNLRYAAELRAWIAWIEPFLPPFTARTWPG